MHVSPAKVKIESFVRSSFGIENNFQTSPKATVAFQNLFRKEKLNAQDIETFASGFAKDAKLVELQTTQKALDLLLEKLHDEKAIFKLHLMVLWLSPLTVANREVACALWGWHRCKHGPEFIDDYLYDFYQEAVSLNDKMLSKAFDTLGKLNNLDQFLSGKR